MSEEKKVLEKVEEYLVDNYSLSLKDIDPEATLLDTGLDSLAMLSIINIIENECDLQIRIEEIEGMHTFGDMLCYANKNIR